MLRPCRRAAGARRRGRSPRRAPGDAPAAGAPRPGSFLARRDRRRGRDEHPAGARRVPAGERPAFGGEPRHRDLGGARRRRRAPTPFLCAHDRGRLRSLRGDPGRHDGEGAACGADLHVRARSDRRAVSREPTASRTPQSRRSLGPRGRDGGGSERGRLYGAEGRDRRRRRGRTSRCGRSTATARRWPATRRRSAASTTRCPSASSRSRASRGTPASRTTRISSGTPIPPTRRRSFPRPEQPRGRRLDRPLARAPRHPRNPRARGRRQDAVARLHPPHELGRGRARRARARGHSRRAAGHAVVKDVLRSVAYGVIVLVLLLLGLRILGPPGPTAPAPQQAAGSGDAVAAPRPPTALGPDVIALRARTLLYPVEGIPPNTLRDSFAEGRGGHLHEAVDILAPRGTRVLAVDDGRVVKLFNSVRGGLTVYQFDSDGDLLLLLRPPRRLRPLARGRCPRPKRRGARIRGHDRQRSEGHAAPPLQHLQARPRAALVGGHADQPVRDLGGALRGTLARVALFAAQAALTNLARRPTLGGGPMKRPLRLLLGTATWLGLAAAAWLASRRRASSEPGRPAATKRARTTTRRRGGATRGAAKGCGCAQGARRAPVSTARLRPARLALRIGRHGSYKRRDSASSACPGLVGARAAMYAPPNSTKASK